ncbi:hypothetical protein [Halopiger aswanensis]|uniref:Uncharacterized protein n=1 Tax=Halopiger aswanensis TaxID=148449 RepID=A0A3R7EE97_9EURY|nr:hypothetical protein [Halopiger aswanensis]RKD94665.1 hypothetical protein ATJ93_1502 [Halopiger aswanensis]
MLSVGLPAAAAAEEAETEGNANAGTHHVLEDDEGLYLVFGADLGDMTLEEYIDAHASGDELNDVEVSQYQDVDQVNINQQENATSISIDGGEATAVQEASQYNDNQQNADVAADSAHAVQTQFEDVGEVTILIGDGDGKSFDGWGIADKKGDKAALDADDADQTAEAEVTQVQEVGQLNYNEQNIAFAIAENNSEATALQQSQQSNENLQRGVANATNVYVGNGQFEDQAASAAVQQGQAVTQENINQQDGAVAIAVGNGSVATAIQITEQTNLNEQLGSATAENVIQSLGGMNVATAGLDDDTQVLDTERSVETLLADKEGDHHKKSGEKVQTATSEVAQNQTAEQMNVNLQNTALALATNESDATAVQLAYQSNINSQVGFADALNVYAGPSHQYENAVVTSTTSVTVGGEDVDGIEGLSYDTDALQTNDAQQHASAQLAQVQFITQENVNEQQAAIAVAENGDSADAAQVTMQENENIQFGSVAATNLWTAA